MQYTMYLEQIHNTEKEGYIKRVLQAERRGI